MYKIMSNNLVECSNVVDLEAAVQYYTFLEIKLFTMLLKCIKKVILCWNQIVYHIIKMC